MPDERQAIYRWRDGSGVHTEQLKVHLAIDRAIADMQRPAGDRHPEGVFSLHGELIVSQTRLNDILAERLEDEASNG